jgi:hypothetical protein
VAAIAQLNTVVRGIVEVNGKRFVLREISDCACYEGESFVIPKTVENIGARSFHRCGSLTYVSFEFDSELKIIGDASFAFSGLKSVIIPNTVEKIETCAFSSCSRLVAILFGLGSKLRQIGDFAFKSSRVKTIDIPRDCQIANGLCLVGLESIICGRKGNGLAFEDDFLVDTQKNSLVRYFGKKSRVEVPAGIECILNGCFCNCVNLTEVIFPPQSKVKEFREDAFSSSGLESLRIPSTVERIGAYCFSECDELAEVLFEPGSRLKEIGKHGFSFSALRSIRIPKSVEKIGSNCFDDGDILQTVEFEPDSHLKEIGRSPFRGCGIRTVEIPNGLGRMNRDGKKTEPSLSEECGQSD